MSQKKIVQRLLLKLSGEMLAGAQKSGIDPNASRNLALAIKGIRQSGIEVGLVIGGGNIFRGINLNGLGMERTPADHMGMLGTLINGIALQQSLLSVECPAKVMTALDCPKVAESYRWERALELLQSGTVVIFVGGTGNPYFTTDTAAALRASEIHADMLLKATKVDGIYSKDPLKYSDAVKYSHITYSQLLAEKLEVMDSTAVALCRSSKIPIFVFNMELLGKQPIAEIIRQEELGTIVKGE